MTPPTLESIARPSGALAMVAMDPRESLRTMFDAAGAGRPPDRALIDFKRNVADVLGPLASGFLLDREYGFDEIRARLAPTAGPILAADALTQDHGAPVEETGLDPVVLEPDFDLRGVDVCPPHDHRQPGRPRCPHPCRPQQHRLKLHETRLLCTPNRVELSVLVEGSGRIAEFTAFGTEAPARIQPTRIHAALAQDAHGYRATLHGITFPSRGRPTAPRCT
ncbi:hypothetical protein [Mycetocola sp.]|uniref:hypothetical protein n=1 Tax=Mycetocola sp. TaxID=1871042 RepID=UPI00262A79BE|nr:hypothetical protein [Mycetocola sp.]MCU1559542.1 hypothetical protein [Mycetocola sp.]